MNEKTALRELPTGNRAKELRDFGTFTHTIKWKKVKLEKVKQNKN